MYIVSACLLGQNCKYNGGNNRNEDVVEFCKTHRHVTVCPESAGRLPSPRPPAEKVGNRILDKTESGSILLFHNDLENTEQALPSLLTELKQKGFEFAAVEDMIYTENYTIDNTGKQIYQPAAAAAVAGCGSEALEIGRHAAVPTAGRRPSGFGHAGAAGRAAAEPGDRSYLRFSARGARLPGADSRASGTNQV